MIEVFKWVKGMNEGNKSDVLIVSNQDRAGDNRYKLDKFRFRKELSRNWLMNWLVDAWNRLSGHLVGANTLSSFKRGLDGQVRQVAIGRLTG